LVGGVGMAGRQSTLDEKRDDRDDVAGDGRILACAPETFAERIWSAA